MKFVFIIDPIASLKPAKDTTLAIMREAQRRGHSIYISQQHDLFLRGATARIKAKKFNFVEENYILEPEAEFAPADFNAVIMRKDPPFDNEYLYSTYLL